MTLHIINQSFQSHGGWKRYECVALHDDGRDAATSARQTVSEVKWAGPDVTDAAQTSASVSTWTSGENSDLCCSCSWCSCPGGVWGETGGSPLWADPGESTPQTDAPRCRPGPPDTPASSSETRSPHAGAPTADGRQDHSVTFLFYWDISSCFSVSVFTDPMMNWLIEKLIDSWLFLQSYTLRLSDCTENQKQTTDFNLQNNIEVKQQK